MRRRPAGSGDLVVRIPNMAHPLEITNVLRVAYVVKTVENLIKEKIESGAVRPKRGMEILDQYMACFKEETYIDPRGRI